jgi:hypothetical protein
MSSSVATNSRLRKRKAFPITETELNAAPAIIGLRSQTPETSPDSLEFAIDARYTLSENCSRKDPYEILCCADGRDGFGDFCFSPNWREG